MSLKFIKIYAFIFFAITTLNLFAQEKNHEHEVQQILIKLINCSKTMNFKEASKYIAYSGSDEKRDDVDTYNIEERYELNQVKRVCIQLNALLELSEYTIGEYNITLDDNVPHYNLFVHFNSGDQEIVKRLQFLKSGERYLLDQID